MAEPEYKEGDPCRNDKCKNKLKRRPRNKNGKLAGWRGGWGYCYSCIRRLREYQDPNGKPLRGPGRPPKAYDRYLQVKRVYPGDTARELAKRIDVSARTVQRYERRRSDEAKA